MLPGTLVATLMDTALFTECQRVLQVLVLCVITCVLASHVKWWACGSSCGRCVRRVTPMEELIGQFYPGLFSMTPPEASESPIEMSLYASRTLNSGSAEIPNAMRGPSQGFAMSNTDPAGGVNNSIWDGDTFRLTNLALLRRRPRGCCETMMEYVTPPNVTIQGKVYQVVHLARAFQFIPIGRCRPGSTCRHGECVDQYRAHWILVYNHSDSSHGPPVSFSPIEVPSHCECMNVGRP